ncbi:unnamed protein product [Rotaria magnacalcarata]|uniref:Beta-microseminoprotein n=1 Tax=Rotaria magnacalcarata TaxID=392030 RepID=A0A816WY90_9BILA|nr:unnamed protein product [Rotaria magnacalcarata]CAF2228806.1 unnamed protein product [Rotaria magnacalcarata]
MLNTIQAHCSLKALQNPKARNCGIIDGRLRSFNDSWKTKDCQQCSCQRSGISCCSSFVTPVGYDKSCHAVFNKRLCQYDVVRKNNPSIKCRVMSSVGR